ncbi:DHH family phosphoesterase [Olivibacter sitiensis]|uniref:DHH family phosphoesterase n=1 Tax=Olivibacter sitiensis TaxID=376470 RepID=UPI000406172B|nr:DHH family phosphoesterase [Olivibacter sitiensis]
MLTISALKEELTSPKHILITTHFNPDGDALGSSLGLYLWLQSKGHQVTVVVPSEFPDFLSWMPAQEHILVYPKDPQTADSLIAKADFLFCLDFNHLSRINAMENAVRNAPGKKIMIDHHLAPEGFEDLAHWDSHAAATAQLVYDFIVNRMDDRQHISPEIAACLYTGIMTDTGSFRFRSTTAEVHLIVADLITLGAPNSKIHEKVYNSATEVRLRFLGYCLLNCLVVVPEYNTAYFLIRKEDVNRFDIMPGDTEGLVNYALSISGMRLAALFIDRSELIKISLRSIDEIPANEICSKYFNGGGHLNAAGGSSTASMEEVERSFRSILPLYKDYLIE